MRVVGCLICFFVFEKKNIVQYKLCFSTVNSNLIVSSKRGIGLVAHMTTGTPIDRTKLVHILADVKIEMIAQFSLAMQNSDSVVDVEERFSRMIQQVDKIISEKHGVSADEIERANREFADDAEIAAQLIEISDIQDAVLATDSSDKGNDDEGDSDELGDEEQVRHEPLLIVSVVCI
jgi:hypothetical protein